MIDWNEWSDLKINQTMTGIIHDCIDWSLSEDGTSLCLTHFDEVYSQAVMDYCNSWVDVGPIVESIWDYLFSEDEFGVPIWDQIKHSFSINATRAAAIAFLMKNGVTPNEN